MAPSFRAVVIALMCLAGRASSATSAHAGIVTEDVVLPVEILTANQEFLRQTLVITVVRDDQRPRAPFLILGHGRPVSDERKNVSSEVYLEQARYFAGKGYTVFIPIRIGYGATGGPDLEGSGSCDDKNYAPAFAAAAEQTLKVIDYARSLPTIDPDRGVVVGQSYGGMTAIAVAARSVPGIIAAINFAGGGGGDPVNQPEFPCRPDRLAALSAAYGQTARIPTLWVYSEIDRYWGREHPREWFDGFVAAGGNGTFVSLPSATSHGHASFTQSPSAWRPAVEAFLKAQPKPAP